MAHITIALLHEGKLNTPGAVLTKNDWPGGGTVDVLRLLLGNDVIDVWPAKKDHLVALALNQMKRLSRHEHRGVVSGGRDDGARC